MENIPATMDPKTNFSPLAETIEPPLFLKGSSLVRHLLPVPYPTSKDESFLFAKHKAFSLVLRDYNSSYSLYSRYQPGSVLYVTWSHFIVTTSRWDRYCYSPCFTDSSSQSFWMCEIPREIRRGCAVYVFFFYSTKPENTSNLSLYREQRRMSHAIQCLLRPSSSKAFGGGDEKHYYMGSENCYSLRTHVLTSSGLFCKVILFILKAKRGRIGPFRPFSWWAFLIFWKVDHNYHWGTFSHGS